MLGPVVAVVIDLPCGLVAPALLEPGRLLFDRLLA